MEFGELRGMSVGEVQQRLQDLQEEAFNLRFQHTSGQLLSPIRLRNVRREMARIHTLLREHELGMRTLAGGNQ